MCADGDLHIDGGEATVGDGAADSAGEGEAGVQADARQRRGGRGLVGDGLDLGGSGSSHCVGCEEVVGERGEAGQVVSGRRKQTKQKTEWSSPVKKFTIWKCAEEEVNDR